MEILTLIQHDPSLEDAYKLHIRNQLLLITQQEAPAENITEKPSSSSGGLLGILISIAKIFLIILLIFIGLGLLAFVYYRMSRKDDDTGFQDFIIDRLFHGKKDDPESAVHMPIAPSTPIETTPAEPEKTESVDPLKSYVPPAESTDDPLLASESEPSQENTAAMPDWLNPQANTSESISTDPLNATEQNTGSVIDPLAASPEGTSAEVPPTENIGSMPDWLKPQSTDQTTENIDMTASPEQSGGLPDWLKPIDETTPIDSTDSTIPTPHEASSDDMLTNAARAADALASNTTESTAEVTDGELPDWLKPIDTAAVTAPESSEVEDTAQTVNTADSALSSPALPADDTISDAMLSSTAETSENDLPDWLKPPLPALDAEPLPEGEAIAESAAETSPAGTASVSSDPITSPTDAIQADNASVEALSEHTTDDALPDWLDALQQDAAAATQTTEAAIIQSTDALTNTSTDELPSWLIDSAQDMDASTHSESSIDTPDPLVATDASATTSESAPQASESAPQTVETTTDAPEPQKVAKSSRKKKSVSTASSDGTIESSENTIASSESTTESSSKPKKSKQTTDTAPEADATDDIPEWLK